MGFSTRQLLLLNCIMYMTEAPLPSVFHFQGRTLGELVGVVDPSQIDPSAQYDCFISGGEWRRILDCFRSDPVLTGLHIAAIHRDRGPGGGDGRSAVFLRPETREAVVVFKGTQSPEEWADNFAGVNLSDTPHQRNALQWFRRIRQGLQQYTFTLTGHSKGGNKAKYVSILDSTVARCVSFDGQGFSDLFMEKYRSQISHRQSIVENHSAEFDYVNFLFQNTGREFFYIASPSEQGGFARNHSPAAMMHFTPDGYFLMVPAPNGPAPGIAALSRFSDSFFASLTPLQRETSYRTVEALRSAGFSMGESKDFLNVFLPQLSHPDHADDLAYLLAYTVVYQQHFPEFTDHLRSLLVSFGLEDFTRYILLVDGILNLNLPTPFGNITFDSLFDNISHTAQGIPSGLLAILIGWAARQGIYMTASQLRQLLAILPRVNDYMGTITIPHTPPRASGLARFSRSLELLGTVMGGNVPGESRDTAPSRLQNTGSRLRTISQITGQISSVLQQPPTTGDDEV